MGYLNKYIYITYTQDHIIIFHNLFNLFYNILNTCSCKSECSYNFRDKGVKIKMLTQNLHTFLDIQELRVFYKHDKHDKTDCH